MQTCESCGREFPRYTNVGGVRFNAAGRKRCLDCRPHRPLRAPRRPVIHPVSLRPCASCGRLFPPRAVIDGRPRYLYRRRFCFACSPFGQHNTSKSPLGISLPEELRAVRRRRKNAQTYRTLKKRRRARKALLIKLRGGRCQDCGYATAHAALEFHHRDASTKEFGVGNWYGSFERLVAEAEKCDLLCATCHRVRHALLDESRGGDPVVEHRRRRKLKAIAHMGGECDGCGLVVPAAAFEFHHRDAEKKEFGISQTGNPRRWEETVAELAKCVMLCANCHREVHAGVRELFDDGLLGLAEDASSYGDGSTRCVASAA